MTRKSRAARNKNAKIRGLAKQLKYLKYLTFSGFPLDCRRKPDVFWVCLYDTTLRQDKNNRDRRPRNPAPL